jgi:iron-sulfur cluster insertion protein
MSQAVYKESDNQMQAAISFTENAARKVYELIEEEGNPKLMLRVYITGGGCSGFQYGFSFDETQNADDTVIEKWIKKNSAKSAANDEEIKDDEEGGDEGGSGGMVLVKLLVDAMSLQYLTGAEIDYKCDLDGEQFIIRNPNAKTTCGCGSSFSA